MAYRRDTMGAGQQETASGWNERENLRREKMDIEDRAKQFMPFDALKGFKQALRKKEKKLIRKRIPPLDIHSIIRRKPRMRG